MATKTNSRYSALRTPSISGRVVYSPKPYPYWNRLYFRARSTYTSRP